MALMHDSSGAATTIANVTALAHWNATIEHVLAHAAAAPNALAATLDADPDFALGHAARGIMLMTLARTELVDDARCALNTAQKLAGSQKLAARERCYIEALAHWIDQRPGLAAHQLEQAIRLDNRDVLAAKFVHAIRFMMGDLRGMLVSARRHLDTYGMELPHSGYLLGCLAFATEENGDYAAAEAMGRQALEMTPSDAWGRHSVAHVMEMTGRAREGAAWLAGSRAHWNHCSNFAFHLSWHEALFHLELGNWPAALDLYDQDLRARKTDDFRDIANAASLLQRLELAGTPVGHRWHELADLAANRIDDRALVFADLHYALALAGAGRQNEVDLLARNLSDDHGICHDARIARTIGAPVASAIMAFRERRYGEAARLLLMARPQLRQIGGSHAQRDVFEQMLIESAIRSGNLDLADALLRQRLDSRGGHNDFAARRLTQVSYAARRPAGKIAAALVAMAPSPAMH